MAVAVQIRRGTKAALTAHGALASGELGFTTDEKLVYVGDGTSNYLVGKVASGAGVPSGNLVAGTLYVNTLTEYIYFCDGSTWTAVGAAAISSLDGLADGSSYKRVAAADITSGHVTQLYNGATAITASALDTHINSSASIHRSINDSGSAETDLWSAQKIANAIAAATVGVGEFQIAVKDSATLTPPGSPTTGDRYLINGTGAGGWSGKDKQIAQWSGSAWVYTVPVDGMAVYSDATQLVYLYNSGTTSWLVINNYALASSKPGAVSSSSSGQTGSASTVARSDHNHDLGSHGHTGSTDGGQVAYSALSSIPTTFAPSAHGASAHSGNIGAEGDITFGSSTGHDHTGVAGHGKQITYTDLASIPSSFTPSSHASSHKNGGGDEIASATAVANGIPKAGSGGTISDGWLPTIDGGSF